MSSLLYVGGSSQGVGKTFVALGLLHLLKQNFKTGAWKPVEVGQMVHHAKNTFTDGERLRHAAGLEDHINWVNPFLLNEDLPPVLAARRDGIRLKTQVLDQYFEELCRRFEWLVIEGGRSLHSPLTETDTELECLLRWNPKVLWVTTLGERELAETLLQVRALQASGLEVCGIVLSNGKNLKHADLIHYQWLTLEEQLSVRILALLPFLKTHLEDVPAIGRLLIQHFDESFLDLLGN